MFSRTSFFIKCDKIIVIEIKYIVIAQFQIF